MIASAGIPATARTLEKAGTKAGESEEQSGVVSVQRAVTEAGQ
jgi:hypothetical protein